MARELYQFHRIPYIGNWDHSPPGIIYLHFIGIWLFGTADTTVRILDIILQLGFCIVFYRLCRMWLSRHTSSIATILYAAFYVSGGLSVYFERDPYALMFCLTGFYLLARSYHSNILRMSGFIVAALLTGYSILLKPTAGLYAIWNGIFILLPYVESHSIGKRIARLVAFIIVAAIPLAVVLFFYASIRGGLEALYIAVIRFNLDLYVQMRSGSLDIALNLLRTALLFPFAAYGLWVLYRSQAQKEEPPVKRYLDAFHRRIPAWFYYGALASAVAVSVIQGKFWRYQLLPVAILVMPLAAVTIETIVERFQRPLVRHYALIGCIVLCSFIQMNPKSQASLLYAITHRQSPFGDTYDFAKSTRQDYGVKAERRTLHYLDSMGVKDREVEIGSIEPHLILHFQHEALGAFGFLHRIELRTDGNFYGTAFTTYQREWQRDYMDTLRQNRPRFIVICRSTIYDAFGTVLHFVPGFDSFLSAQYVRDTAFGSYEIYRHR
ncbi:MAG TPA: glycosyltransferase family 39 protein [Candidatus Kapabacteria bacterium]|nr:glycosyltransferase family 39 protein [Candidatus Kapabacteria bacterium]